MCCLRLSNDVQSARLPQALIILAYTCSFEETMYCVITDEAVRNDGVKSHALFCSRTLAWCVELFISML